MQFDDDKCVLGLLGWRGVSKWIVFCYNQYNFLTLPEKLYNVDEALLHSQQEKHRMLMEHMERLERESQTVSLSVFLSCFSRFIQVRNLFISGVAVHKSQALVWFWCHSSYGFNTTGISNKLLAFFFSCFSLHYLFYHSMKCFLGYETTK